MPCSLDAETCSGRTGRFLWGQLGQRAGPPPGHRIEGQRPADAQSTSCHGGHGLTASGQEDGVVGSCVSDDSGMHCTLPRKVWKHTANRKLLGYPGMQLPPPGCSAISQSPRSGPLSAQAAAVRGLPSLGTCLGPGCTPSEMHVTARHLVWEEPEEPAWEPAAAVLALPVALRPALLQICMSQAQRAEFHGSHPISGDPAPRPGSPWPLCLPRAEPPRPQRVGGWCPTVAGTPGRGLSLPRPPCPPGWMASFSAPCPQLRPPPCAHPALGAMPGLQSSDISGCPGPVGTLGCRWSWAG